MVIDLIIIISKVNQERFSNLTHAQMTPEHY